MADPITPAAIMQLGLGFWGSKTLLSAVELGVFSELGKQPLDADALRERLGLQERGGRDFFDALVGLGMLERDGGVYRNTPATAQFLDSAKPTYIGGFLEMVNGRLYGFWGGLTEGLRTGRPQNEIKGGNDLFTELYADATRLKGFLHAMLGISIPPAAALARKFPWQDYKSVCDVGGALGTLLVEVASVHEHLTGVGFDLPEVGPLFDEYVASRGLSERLSFAAGDFFADDLPQADVLVFGHILHDWDLEQKKMLLTKAHKALPDGGAVVVYEFLIDDERRENVTGLLMSLNMLIETQGGFDYTGADCSGWMKEAGFRDTRVEHLGGPESMVVGIK